MFKRIPLKKGDLIWTAGLFIAVVLTMSSACSDEPLPPRTNRWELAAELPGSVVSVNGMTTFGTRNVYICGQETGDLYVTRPAVIYKYSNSKMEKIFSAPIPYSGFWAVNAGGGLLWAAGSKQVGSEKHRPYVVYYNNRAWEEVPVPLSIDESGFYDLYPSDGLFCWFVGDKGIYTYEAGAWEKQLSLPEYGTNALAVTKSGKAFVYIFNWGNHRGSVYISGDRGRTWVPENVVLPYSNLKLVEEGIEITAPADDTIYLYGLAACGKEYSEVKYGIIIARDNGPAGGGEYTLAFAAPPGPNFYGIRDMAFKSVNDGYAVGRLTSVALERGEWSLDKVPESWSPHFKAVVPGVNSYWAIIEASESHTNPALYEAR
jgi:hypothetical protein